MEYDIQPSIGMLFRVIYLSESNSLTFTSYSIEVEETLATFEYGVYQIHVMIAASDVYYILRCLISRIGLSCRSSINKRNNPSCTSQLPRVRVHEKWVDTYCSRLGMPTAIVIGVNANKVTM